MEYRARSGTVTIRAEFAPNTALSWATNPHAKIDVDLRFDSSMSLCVETPLLAVMAQHTIPSPARGTMMALKLNTCRILVVCIRVKGRAVRKARKKPISP